MVEWYWYSWAIAVKVVLLQDLSLRWNKHGRDANPRPSKCRKRRAVPNLFWKSFDRLSGLRQERVHAGDCGLGLHSRRSDCCARGHGSVPRLWRPAQCSPLTASRGSANCGNACISSSTNWIPSSVSCTCACGELVRLLTPGLSQRTRVPGSSTRPTGHCLVTARSQTHSDRRPEDGGRIRREIRSA
jgi:hypothetical protein